MSKQHDNVTTHFLRL